jgi:hypothetical protein
MSTIKANTLTVKCGSTLTLGESGKTISIASGASTSGMGRAGAVDWQTTVKTTSFTASNGEGYFVDTSGGAVTVTLPASPSAGNIIAVSDYANNFATANCILSRNGSKIGGVEVNSNLKTNGLAVSLVFIDSTKGWIVTDSGNQDEAPTATYISASGGTPSTDGDFKVHTFTSPGNFVVSSVGNSEGSNEVSYLVVGGGAGGGVKRGGGGGAGGFREGKSPQTPYTSSPIVAPAGLPVSAQTYPIVVGAGGTAGVSNNPICANATTANTNGSVSTFSSITSAGGGAGGGTGTPSGAGAAGGSGGGGVSSMSGRPAPASNAGGAGNTPPVSPAQGFAGGSNCEPQPAGQAGGGGGATTVGADGGDGQATTKGAGGTGASTEISGSAVVRSGGGGGGARPNGSQGAGGSGGGGSGANCASRPDGLPNSNGASGTANTGGGGGGTGDSHPSTSGAGGSGVVIIRYKFQN